jgi:hypothetical protein
MIVVTILGCLFLAVLLTHQYGSPPSYTREDIIKQREIEEADRERFAMNRMYAAKYAIEKSQQKRKEELFKKIIQKIPEKDLESILGSLDGKG